MAKVLNFKENIKAKTKDYSDMDAELEHFIFENLYISVESDLK